VRADLELLEAWRDGDRDAGDELLARHFDSVCRFFRSKLGDDVEDLIQQTFLACVEGHAKVRDTNSFRSYLFAVARNRLFDHLRQAYRRPAHGDLASHSIADLGTSPSGKVARTEQERLLLQAMREIPIDYQIALELAYWEEMPGREIAVVLGIAENTVRSRLSRARAALRDAVDRLATTPELSRSTLRQFDSRARI